ncbi:MAG: hypothetical protein MJY44_05770 [Bacteroidales bacterium]|nr:hypothetical protein [Bacteroidales bacterium]
MRFFNFARFRRKKGRGCEAVVDDVRPCIPSTIVKVDAVLFDTEMDTAEIFYYEKQYVEALNGAIREHKSELDGWLEERGRRLVYLPDWNKELAADIRYICPYVPLSDRYEPVSYQALLDFLHIDDDIDGPSLIRFHGESEGKFIFSVTPVGTHDYDGLVLALTAANRLSFVPRLMYMRAERPTADDMFDEDVKRIGLEIRDRVRQLKSKGLSAVVIRSLFGQIEENPSHLKVDSQYRLFLTDYGDREIRMSPVHKAVFLLFLKHPEGIFFKDLASYRDELGAIYSRITGREDPDAVEDTLDRLTDPYDNSINEKCARIKNAFVSEFSEEIAWWYYIDGKRGERKLIRLPRDLVVWESGE